MTDFLLLHGASHGAWSWHLTVAELERRGHRALAIDLPIGDPQAGAERYAEVATEAARGRFDGPLVVVGHSLSGIVIPLLPERLEVEELVFLCSLLPIPGVSMLEQWQREADMLVPDLAEDMPEWTPPADTSPDDVEALPADAAAQALAELRDRSRAMFYHDCESELASLAADHLRHQEMAPMLEPSPVTSWPPTVPVRYVAAREDRAVNPAWSIREVPRRLGVEAIVIDGGHSPFLSRPVELVDVLLGRTSDAAARG